MTSTQKPQELVALQDICKKIIDMPYCSGSVLLDGPGQSLLFYRSNEEARFIDFAAPSEEQLKALADACSPASFGMNQEDVLDENYRKAGKMDTTDFALQFSPWSSGILKTVVDSLFKTEGSIADVKAELYKLNVYGPGSFFKAHVDTPRSDTMFGSLVVVLPTPHTGGSLLFRHNNTEYTFDSAAAVSGSSSDAPQAAFAAFFSDVEHEVQEVTSGYRVTLTYNLYKTAPNDDKGASNISTSMTIQDEAQTVLALKNALDSLLRAPTFLPTGGLLAFGLAYDYPFTPHSTRLSDIGRSLKGIDALLKRACDASGLQVSLKTLYREPHWEFGTDVYCFLDRFVRLGGEQVEDSLIEYLCQCVRGAVVGYDALAPAPASGSGRRHWTPPSSDEYARGTEVLGVVWAKALDSKNAFKEQYIAYGNEASLACAYGKVCLVVRIKPVGERV